MIPTYDEKLARGGVKRPILLWGATMYGEMAYQVLTKVYHRNIEAVVDNKYSTTVWADVKVIRSNELEQYSGVDILVCAANAFDIIVSVVSTYEKNDIKAYDIRRILEKYKETFMQLGISSSYLYGDIDLDEVLLKYNYYAGINNGYDKSLYLPYCVMCITTKCTLKCRNCAAFMNHYTKRENQDVNVLISNFSKILDSIDGITELELMGGEPFLHDNFDDILMWCIRQKKIRAIKIITNGTILPKTETWENLAHYKVKLVIDDYGELSRNMNALCEMAEKYKVRYERQALQTWYQIEPIFKKNFSKEHLEKIFSSCTFRTCVGLTNGRFYHCNVSGHMNQVSLLPDEAADYIQIENVEWKAAELRNAIKKFLNIKYLSACSYCNYSSMVECEVAQQYC